MDYTRAEAAERAGVDRAYLDRLIDLGIVRSGDSDDRVARSQVRRAQLAAALDTAGIEPTSLAVALRSGQLTLDFMDAPSYERFATLADETFQQVSERTSLPLQLVTLIREATGSAAPDPGDRMREDEMSVVPFIEAELAMGFRPISVERALRVAGDGFRRLAETESDAWRADVLGTFIAAGMTARDVAAASTAEQGQWLDQMTDRALLALWHAHQARAWTANIIGGFEQALTEAGLATRSARPPAICFLDITGYTRLTQERGDAAAASLAERLGRLVNATSVRHGGRPVKWLGDGVMVYFPDGARSVLAALDMVDGVADAGLPPAHVGVHAGPVLFQEGDYFGRTVNLASRVGDYARPGEVLATQEAVNASAEGVATFTEIGPVELKSVTGVVFLYAAHRAS